MYKIGAIVFLVGVVFGFPLSASAVGAPPSEGPGCYCYYQAGASFSEWFEYSTNEDHMNSSSCDSYCKSQKETTSMSTVSGTYVSATETCDSGSTKTCYCTTVSGSGYDEDSCKSSCENLADTNVAITTYQLQCAVDGVLTTVVSGSIDQEDYEPTPELEFVTPDLSVDIPGLDLDPASLTSGSVSSNYIGEYIEAVYKWMIGAFSLLAVIVLMISGFQYMASRGDSGKVSQAKTRITQSIIGLILLFGAYTIAFFIDPNTTIFESLSLELVKQENFPPQGEDLNLIDGVSISGEIVAITGSHIQAKSTYNYLNPDALTALQQAAAGLYAKSGNEIVISSATRRIEKQAELFHDNCLSNENKSCTIGTCNPARGSSVISGDSNGFTLTGELEGVTDRTTIINSLARNGNVANCPHTSTVAVDAWCNDGGGNYVHNPQCQADLTEIMINSGFCRLGSEAWHFELNSKKVSGSCSTANTLNYTTGGKTYTPNVSCEKWDYGTTHTCQ